MAATLGLRGTGVFSAAERPQNWREMLLYLFPNGEAPLTALLSMLKSQPTDDPIFNWWEKRLPTQRLISNDTGLLADTTITVVSGALDCVAGTLLMNELTGEIIKVSADPTIDTELTTVVRGYGTVVATNFVATTDPLTIVGNVHEEGIAVPTSKSYSPTNLFNYTQIFRMPLSLTRTAKKTRLRWDNTGPYREAKREALSLHSIEMEKAFIWGQKHQAAGAAGNPERATGGVLSFLTTNKGTVATPGIWGSAQTGVGSLDEDTLDAMCESIFRYGSTEKLAFCGSTFLRAITTLGKRNGTLQMVPQDKVYGMKVIEYITAFGSLMLKNHPLMSQHPAWRTNALVLDPTNMMYRYIDDTMFLRNRQNPGDDLSKDEFLTESGLEIYFEETHAYIQGVTGALIA